MWITLIEELKINNDITVPPVNEYPEIKDTFYDANVVCVIFAYKF